MELNKEQLTGVDLDQILASLTPEEQLELAKSELLQREQQSSALALKFEPQEYQIGAFRSRAKIRLLWGSNRTGKSLSEVAEGYWWAMGNHPYRRTPRPPCFIRHSCVSYNEGIRQVLLPLYQSFCPPGDLLGGSWDKAYSKEDRTLYFDNGSQIDFMSYEQDANKYSGVKRHLNIYDEPPLQDIWYENQARLLDFNGDTLIGLTPILTARSAFIKEDLYDKAGVDKDIEMFFFDIFKNKYITKEARDAYIKTIPADEREARIYGRIIMLAGLIYKEFRDSRHVLEGFSINDDEHTIYVSVDPHPRKPTYVLFGAVDREDKLYLWDEINMKAGVPEICKVIKTKLGKRTLEQGWIDNSAVEEDLTSGESILQQFIDNGIYLNPIEGKLKNNTMGFTAVKNRLGVDEVSHKPTMFFFKNGVPILIHSMKNYAYDDYLDPRLAGVKEKPFKRYDDPPDTLRYMVINNPYYVSSAKRRFKQEQKRPNIYSYLKK